MWTKQVVLSFFRSDFISDRWQRYPLLVALLINIIMWIVIIINIKAQDKPIPLHANAFYGVELVGSGFRFFFLPLIGLVVTGINTIISYYIFRFDQLLPSIINFCSAVLQGLLFIATLNIVFLTHT